MSPSIDEPIVGFVFVVVLSSVYPNAKSIAHYLNVQVNPRNTPEFGARHIIQTQGDVGAQ